MSLDQFFNKCRFNFTFFYKISKGGSRTAARSKMECFLIIVNGFSPLTIITKRSIFDVAAGLDPPLIRFRFFRKKKKRKKKCKKGLWLLWKISFEIFSTLMEVERTTKKGLYL